MQDSWLSSRANEIQANADRHDAKRFYDTLRAVYRPPFSGFSPLLRSDGSNLLTDKQLILERWAEHFYILTIGTNVPSTPVYAFLTQSF